MTVGFGVVTLCGPLNQAVFAVECVLFRVEGKRRQREIFFLIHVAEDVLLPMISRLWDPPTASDLERLAGPRGRADYTFDDGCVDGPQLHLKKKKIHSCP